MRTRDQTTRPATRRPCGYAHNLRGAPPVHTCRQQTTDGTVESEAKHALRADFLVNAPCTWDNVLSLTFVDAMARADA